MQASAGRGRPSPRSGCPGLQRREGPTGSRASQSKRPSATTAQEGARPSRPSPSTGLGPGSAWNLGDLSGSMARPTSQRTRPPGAKSGTTTMPANRSAPPSANSPDARALCSPNPAVLRYWRSPSPGAKPSPRRQAVSKLMPLGRQVLLRFGVAKHGAKVEPRRRRQQRWVPLGNHNGAGPTGTDWGLGGNDGSGHRPRTSVEPLYRLGQAEPLDLLHEVQHVASNTASEAVKPFRVVVHREAALGLVAEGTDALTDAAPSLQLHARRLHHGARRMPRLQRLDVHLS